MTGASRGAALGLGLGLAFLAGYFFRDTTAKPSPQTPAPQVPTSAALLSKPTAASKIGHEEGDRSAADGREDAVASSFEAASHLPHRQARDFLSDHLKNLSRDEAIKALKILGTDARFRGMLDLSGTAVACWINEAPLEYISWLHDESEIDPATASEILCHSFGQLGLPQAAEAWKSLERVYGDRSALFGDAFMQAFADRDPVSALSLADALFRNSPHRQQALSTVYESWAEVSPQEAMGSALSHSAPEDRAQIVSQVMSTWADDDAAAAEDYLRANVADPAVRQAGYAILAEIRAEEDPEAASDWMNKLPPGSAGVDAIVNLTRNLVLKDPQAALAWNAAIPDATARKFNESDLLSTWALSDPSAARAYQQSHAAVPERRD